MCSSGTCAKFQFQTGSIKRLFENNIDIILYPYSSCQLILILIELKGSLLSTANRAKSLGG